MSEELGATVLALAEQAEPFASGPEGIALRGALRAAQDALSRPPERYQVAEQALRTAAERALELSWSRPVPLPWMLDLGEALSACIVAQPRTAKLFGAGIGGGDATPVAASDRPVLWSPVASFSESAMELAAPAPAVPVVMEPRADADEDDAEPSAREPRELSPVDRFDPAAAAAPMVTVLADVGLPMPLADLRRERAARSLDSIAMHARHRGELPFTRAAGEEERILAWLDAARIQGGALPAALFAWWSAAKTAPDPWRVFSPMLVLGSFAGDDALGAVERVLSAFPEDTPGAVPVAAEALALTAHPLLSALGHDLLRAAHPVARAVGVELGRVLGTLGLETVRDALRDPNVSVVAAAARACAAPAMSEITPALALGHPHPSAAWEIARAVTLAGRRDAIDLARHDRAFAARLGGRLVDLVVMAGGAADQPLLIRAVKRAPPSRQGFRALARFGHPRSWLYLAQYLADEDLADFAADALETIFGSIVSDEQRTDAPAWRAALTARRLDPELRLWRGQPWHPSILAEEIASGSASRIELQAWGDEVRARLALSIELDLSRWAPESKASASDFVGASGSEGSYPRGRWWCSRGGTQ